MKHGLSNHDKANNEVMQHQHLSLNECSPSNNGVVFNESLYGLK
jgi:hypothetical protein